MRSPQGILTAGTQVEKAVSILQQGGLVAFPTDTLYALGAHAFIEAAVHRVYQVKGRPREMALPLLLASAVDMEKVAVRIPQTAWDLAERFWPGALGKMRTVSPIQQVQFVQVALDRIEVRVRLERPLTLAEEKSAIDITRDVLGYPFHVDIKPDDAIERGPSGKFEEFLSLVNKPD